MRGREWVGVLRERALTSLDFVRAHRLISELARVELIDRAMALGAQALLALIPLLMAMGALLPSAWGADLLAQIRDVIGVQDDELAPLREAAVRQGFTQPENGLLSLLVSLASATSFSRALQRMYARVWELPTYFGVRALRSSLIWLVGWVAMLEVTTLLVRSVAGVPLTGVVRVTIQLLVNTALWWWTARLLVGGRVSWKLLLPGAVFSAVFLVVLSRLSSLFMPRFASANLDQFGPLGVVFAVASWLVLFGGVIVVATVIGRLVGESQSSGRTRLQESSR